MFKKKYGRMTPRAWLNAELEQTSPVLMILFGFLTILAGILVRAFTGSPHMMLLALGVSDLVPPVWLMSLLWSLSFLVIGCSFGFVLGCRSRALDCEKYRGGMFFVLLFVLELCWYPTFFGAGLVFLSVLESILILCLSVAVTVSFYRVSKFPGVLFLLHDVWLVYILILNFTVFFRS